MPLITSVRLCFSLCTVWAALYLWYFGLRFILHDHLRLWSKYELFFPKCFTKIRRFPCQTLWRLIFFLPQLFHYPFFVNPTWLLRRALIIFKSYFDDLILWWNFLEIQQKFDLRCSNLITQVIIINTLLRALPLTLTITTTGRTVI